MNLVKLKRISLVISTISLCCAMASCKKEEKPKSSWVLEFTYNEKYMINDVTIGISFGVNQIQHLSTLNSRTITPDPQQKIVLEVFNKQNESNKHILYTDEGITKFYVYELLPTGEKNFSFHRDFQIPSDVFTDYSGSISFVFNIYLNDEIVQYYGKTLKYFVTDDYVSFSK